MRIYNICTLLCTKKHIYSICAYGKRLPLVSLNRIYMINEWKSERHFTLNLFYIPIALKKLREHIQKSEIQNILNKSLKVEI